MEDPLVDDDAGCSAGFPPLFDITDEELDCRECLVLLAGVLLRRSAGSGLFRNSNKASSLSTFFLGTEGSVLGFDAVLKSWNADSSCLYSYSRAGTLFEGDTSPGFGF